MNKYYLFIPLALLLLFSSCASLRIEKRHYNKGFYVDFGNDKKTSATVDNLDKPEVAVVENAPQPVQENADRAIPFGAATDNKAQGPSVVSANSNEVTEEPTPTGSSSTEIDQQKDSTRIENNAPEGSPAGNDSDVALILLVILAIILPPLAVFLVEGVSKWFWVTLILCIFGGGFFFTPYLGGLWLIAVIIALFVVFGLIS